MKTLKKNEIINVSYMAIPSIKQKGNYRSNYITPETLERACDYFGYTLKSLQLRHRKSEKVMARQKIWYYLVEDRKQITQQTGADLFKLINHATVISELKKIKGLLEVDKQLAKEYEEFKKFMQNI